MTRTVKVREAKTHLSALLASVEQGEEVLITRGATPAARLVPVVAVGRRELGFVSYQVPASFDDQLPDVELSAWEGR